jgi:hypothetical protein
MERLHQRPAIEHMQTSPDFARRPLRINVDHDKLVPAEAGRPPRFPDI